MLTVAQFRKTFTDNGGLLAGKIIEKVLKDTPNKQLFAQMVQKKEVRHFLVDLLQQKIYEGSLYFKTETNQFIFGYLDFPVISYTLNDMQVRQHNTTKKS